MWIPTAPGIGEARLFALQTLIQSKIADLNTCLNRDSVTAPLIDGTMVDDETGAVLNPPITTDAVRIGDTDALWESEVGGMLRFVVCSGGAREGLDYGQTMEFIDASSTGGNRYELHTAILCYVHTSAFNMDDPVAQAFSREIVRERASDWLRAGVLNAPRVASQYNGFTVYPPQDLVLASQEFCPSGGQEYDTLTRCRAAHGTKSFFVKSFRGNIPVYGFQIDHIGTIA